MSNSNPINKGQQVYTDRYGHSSTPSHPTRESGGDYNNFDAGMGQEDALDPSLYGEEYGQVARGQSGEGVPDGDLIGGMNNADYEAHYRNQVEPEGRREADELLADVRNRGEDGFDPKHEIAEIKKTLGKPENQALFDDESKGALNDRLHELERLAGKRNANPEELQDKIEELKGDIESSLVTGRQMRQEQVADLKGKIDDLKQEIEDSHLSDAKKEEMTDQLDDLLTNIKKPSTDLEEAKTTLKHLKKELKDTPAEWMGSRIAGNVPPDQNSGHQADRATNIINKINEAMSSGNWSAVHDAIYAGVGYESGLPADGDERNHKIWNDVIRKVITAIYRSCPSREVAVSVLKNIPENIRNDMINAASIEGSEMTEKTGSDEFNTNDGNALIRESIIGGSGSTTPTTTTPPATGS